ncbi:hypothetical protein CC1G_10548 [Coprinopsis cinerea okayama7|uniref:Uncharacterized protein n=1 Tax=Coprinopsis cinerea (strain Okayama-7 / 130 / ATCC MYA-4618 / FGSC 9003) TaxID=240176 RepID=A8N1C7_COPC7|nr:hypothetical protein CC1G_10548 [Coprinopsis cinerea okayama7\|eukprot:XP_001828676.2 hypothetical protein CC1G_10548 [Coprinopsis cinerea okayama7\
MASTELWRDFEQIRDIVAHRLTVDKLKSVISSLNDDCAAGLQKTGKKQDLINRLSSFLDNLRNSRMDSKWQRAKTIINEVKSGSHIHRISVASLQTSFPSVAGSSSSYSGIKTGGYPSPIIGTSGPSTLHRYDPYAPPVPNGASASASTSSTSSRPIAIRFKDSPFFTIEQQVSSVVECPESTSAMDRRQQTLTFTLNNDQVYKLKSSGSRYQLRLFCTSSVFYSPSRNSGFPCPIEFPPTCEVRVNGAQITASLKGLKKKPGTAPPPDLMKYVRLSTQQNRIEMVYVNSTQPVQSKKFYLVVMLVETKTVDSLVENLKANCRRSSLEVRQKMLESLNDDDDIQAGPQKMSLKCPLSFMRVNTPCRSSKCVHPQCFDAASWFYMMEQTTTYLCPTCERVLDHRDLIIDGYFEEILQQTDDDVEDVIVEADGEWHTSDNKYASAKWRAGHPVAPKTISPNPVPATTTNGAERDKGKAKNLEVFVLSDDDDEDAVKRELSPSLSHRHSLDSASHPPPSVRSQSHVAEEVIDLTLSDDDEPQPQPPPPPAPVLKRKATELDLPPIDTWKKARGDLQEQQPHSTRPSQHHQAPPPNQISPVYRNPPANDIRPHSGFDHNTRLPGVNGYPLPQPPPIPTVPYYSGRPSLTESRQLPPPPPYPAPYQHQPRGSRWGGQ